MTEETAETSPQPAPEQEEMPACRLARFPPQFYMKRLEPYTRQWEILQGMLFWRRPIPMALLLVAVELAFIFVGVFDLGFLSVAAMALAFYHIFQLIGQKVGSIVAPLFPEIDRGAPEDSNQIYPLLPFCQRFSHLSSVIAEWFDGHRKRCAAGEAVELIKSVVACVVAIIFFRAVTTFWFVWAVVHAFLLLPGAVMHPKAFPYTQPYIMKFAAAIKCPYCHPHSQ